MWSIRTGEETRESSWPNHAMEELSNKSHIGAKIFIKLNSNCYKVEKILKGSLDSIPSPLPLVKIQIISGKFA